LNSTESPITPETGQAEAPATEENQQLGHTAAGSESAADQPLHEGYTVRVGDTHGHDGHDHDGHSHDESMRLRWQRVLLLRRSVQPPPTDAVRR